MTGVQVALIATDTDYTIKSEMVKDLDDRCSSSINCHRY